MPLLHKRRNFLIYPRFQWMLLGLQITSFALVFVFIVAEIYHFLEVLEDMGIKAHLPLDHGYFKLILFQKSYLLTHLGIAFLTALLLSTIGTLFLSHKLAGPIVRLRQHFLSIGEGRISFKTKLAFRKRDFFSDLPTAINKAFEKIQTDIQEK